MAARETELAKKAVRLTEAGMSLREVQAITGLSLSTIVRARARRSLPKRKPGVRPESERKIKRKR